MARLTSESSAPLTQLLGWLPQRLAKGTTITIVSGRGSSSIAAVAKRLTQSGFPVHFLLIEASQGAVSEARQMGLAAWPLSVETERKVPSAVVIGA